MGKRLRSKCTAMDEATVMEARTGAARRLGLVTAGSSWSSKRRKTALASRRYRNANPSLQIRSVVLEPRIARSMAKSAGQSKSSAGLGRISRCSSNASCEVAPTRSASSEVTVATECGSALFLRCNGERRETSASSNRCDEASDLESTVETEPRARSGEAATPSNAELEEFFAAAEKDLRRKFAERYNFDVVNDLPMAGRYEWIPLHSLKKC